MAQRQEYDTDALQEALGVRFVDSSLLELALTHRSYAFEQGLPHDNERLEFLGDSVLSIIITTELYNRLTEESEGRLAMIRAATVSSKPLAQVAQTIGVGEAVMLGVGETQSGGSKKTSILADTMEALIGAIYLDQGLDVARDIVLFLFTPIIDNNLTKTVSLDYKTSLYELVVANGENLVYDVKSSGPTHDLTFTATVIVNGESVGIGIGKTKKEAEQDAAGKAYKTLVGRKLG